MALGILGLVTIGATIISGGGIVALCAFPNKRKGLLYFLAVWGILLAGVKATSLPSNFISSQIIAWGIGVLSVIGLLLHMTAKSDKQLNISYGLVIVSVVVNLLTLFFI